MTPDVAPTAVPVCPIVHALDVDRWGRLVATLPEGVTLSGVEPIRAFPLSSASESIILLDAHGREAVCLASIEGQSPDVRRKLEAALALREFVPVITRIHTSTHPYPPCVWTVDTDRGPAEIAIDSEDDVRRLPDGAVIIADATGLRFRIPSIPDLDVASRRHLRRLL